MVLNERPDLWQVRPQSMEDVRMAVPVAVETWQGKLMWLLDRGVHPSGFRVGRAGRGCLVHFVALADASDEAIAGFAREWGVLGFCREHGRPGIHEGCPPKECYVGTTEIVQLMLGGRIPAVAVPPATASYLPGWKGDQSDRFLLGIDSTDDWRALSRQLRAVQRLAYAAKERKPLLWEDAEAAAPGNSPGLLRMLWNHSPSQFVASEVTLLVGEAQIEPEIVWNEERHRFDLVLAPQGSGLHLFEDTFVWPVGSLYQVLVAQLVAAVTLGELVPCARCGVPFDWAEGGTYRRSPRSDKGAYCTDWHRQEARREQKAAWKRQRDRRRQEQRKEGNDGEQAS